MFPALCSFIIFFLACEMNCIKVSNRKNNFAKKKYNNEDFNIQTKQKKIYKLRLNIIYTQWKKHTQFWWKVSIQRMMHILLILRNQFNENWRELMFGLIAIYTLFCVRIAIVTSHACLLAFVGASPVNSLLLSNIIDI